MRRNPTPDRVITSGQMVGVVGVEAFQAPPRAAHSAARDRSDPSRRADSASRSSGITNMCGTRSHRDRSPVPPALTPPPASRVPTRRTSPDPRGSRGWASACRHRLSVRCGSPWAHPGIADNHLEHRSSDVAPTMRSPLRGHRGRSDRAGPCVLIHQCRSCGRPRGTLSYPAMIVEGTTSRITCWRRACRTGMPCLRARGGLPCAPAPRRHRSAHRNRRPDGDSDQRSTSEFRSIGAELVEVAVRRCPEHQHRVALMDLLPPRVTSRVAVRMNETTGVV